MVLNVVGSSPTGHPEKKETKRPPSFLCARFGAHLFEMFIFATIKYKSVFVCVWALLCVHPSSELFL